MILSIATEKATEKAQHPFLIKALHGAGIEGTEPQYHKSHLQKAHREYHSPWAKTEGFSPKVRSTARMSTLTTVVQHSTRIPSLSNQITKRNKRHLNPQRRSQTFTHRRRRKILCGKPRLHPKLVRTHTGIRQNGRIEKSVHRHQLHFYRLTMRQKKEKLRSQTHLQLHQNPKIRNQK